MRIQVVYALLVVFKGVVELFLSMITLSTDEPVISFQRNAFYPKDSEKKVCTL